MAKGKSELGAPSTRQEAKQPQHNLLIEFRAMDQTEYTDMNWPIVSKAVDRVLSVSPGQPLQISFEEVYSCVYRTASRGFGHQLYTDLVNKKIDPFLAKKDEVLKMVQAKNEKEYLELFDEIINSFLLAAQSLNSVFMYISKAESDHGHMSLNEILMERLHVQLVKHHLLPVLGSLSQLQSKPFAVEPSTRANIVTNLYRINKGYASECINLFSQFIPECIAPSSKHKLDEYIAEVKSMTEMLGGQCSTSRLDSTESRKRPIDFGEELEVRVMDDN